MLTKSRHSDIRKTFSGKTVKGGCCKIMQQPLKLWKCLYSADVGALIERPRAVDNRPYEFYRYIFDFCNSPFLQIYCGQLSVTVIF